MGGFCFGKYLGSREQVLSHKRRSRCAVLFMATPVVSLPHGIGVLVSFWAFRAATTKRLRHSFTVFISISAPISSGGFGIPHLFFPAKHDSNSVSATCSHFNTPAAELVEKLQPMRTFSENTPV